MRMPVRLPKSLRRLRHRRGHGIHSPFVYALSRQVFSRDAAVQADRTLLEALLAEGVKTKTAAEIARLYKHLGFTSFSVAETLPAPLAAGHFCILRHPHEGPLPHPATGRAAVCLLRNTPAGASALTVERRRYTVCFLDPELPAQHFIL